VRVEQNIARALEVADKASVLVGGRIVREGSAEEFRQIEKLFFGKYFSISLPKLYRALLGMHRQ